MTSAKLLLDSGDVDGARTHSGLITAFSLHLVKPGLVAVERGRSSNQKVF